MMETKQWIEQLFERMIQADRIGANRLVEEILAAGLAPENLLTDVLDPAMIQLGKRWGSQTVSLSQTFVAAKIAEDILQRCLPEQDPTLRGQKGMVVIGNIEDDFHSLGRRIVSSFLTATGWDVHDLGNDVPAGDLIEKAIEVNACIIGVSAMMQTTALNIRKVRVLLDERGLSGTIKLAVGGAVFNWRPQLVEEVGGDGTVDNAAEVDALFMRLKAEIEQGEPAE